MVKLTAKHIAERRASVHTPESFGRAFIEQALFWAEQKVGDGEAESVRLDDVAIEVRPIHTADLLCVEVCVKTPFGKVCYHQRIG